MPGLESFCVGVALCLGSIYLLMMTWFVAWLTLDQRRVEKKRNGLIPCITHKSYEPSTEFGDKLTNKVLDIYTTLLTSTVLRILVIVCCLTFFGFGIYGWISIDQVFYFYKLAPSDSYLTKYRKIYDKDYPDDGWPVDVYSNEIKANHLQNINQLVKGLKDLKNEKSFIKGKSKNVLKLSIRVSGNLGYSLQSII